LGLKKDASVQTWLSAGDLTASYIASANLTVDGGTNA
jgi:hypothetical protein